MPPTSKPTRIGDALEDLRLSMDELRPTRQFDGTHDDPGIAVMVRATVRILGSIAVTLAMIYHEQKGRER